MVGSTWSGLGEQNHPFLVRIHRAVTHVTALAALPMLHKDPFDRILIAQAVAEGLGFVTNDGLVSDYPVQTMW